MTVDYHDFTWPDMPLKRRQNLNVGPLYINGALCKKCDYFIRSKNRHDFVQCKCGSAAVDGGSWYGRFVGDVSDVEFITKTFTHLSDFEKP